MPLVPFVFLKNSLFTATCQEEYVIIHLINYYGFNLFLIIFVIICSQSNNMCQCIYWMSTDNKCLTDFEEKKNIEEY